MSVGSLVDATALARDPLGEIDRALVDLLKIDGRMSLSDLGSHLNLSGDAVRERLKKIEAQGLISIIGSVAPAVLGFSTFALLALRVQGPVLPAAETIAGVAAADLVVCVAGKYDILAQLVCRDDEEFLSVVDTQIRTIPGLEVAEVFTYLSVDKYAAGFPQEASPGGNDRGELPRLDDADRALIKTLQADGRATYRALEEASGLTYSSTRRRVKALLDEGVVRIVTVENPLLVGASVQAGIGIQIDGRLNAAREAIMELPEVEVAVSTAGSFDLMLEVTCPDKRALNELAGERLRAIPGIARTQTFQYLRLVKLPYTWAGLEQAPLSPAVGLL